MYRSLESFCLSITYGLTDHNSQALTGRIALHEFLHYIAFDMQEIIYYYVNVEASDSQGVDNHPTELYQKL